jgi:hypothetical protein
VHCNCHAQPSYHQRATKQSYFAPCILARHADNRVKIEVAGGIGCIVTVMHSHPTNSELQHQVRFALANLALHANVWVKIGTSVGIECIATAMRSHPTNSELQHQACAALAFPVFHADNCVKIEAAGGIECIGHCHAQPSYHQRATTPSMFCSS